MYCKKCGSYMEDDSAFCPNCGAAQVNLNNQVNSDGQPNTYRFEDNSQGQYENPYPNDQGGFAWGLLGCCIPLVGLILFLVWKDTKPKTAKAAGIGALVSVIISVVYYVIAIVIGVGSYVLI